MVALAPSILSADFANLENNIKALEEKKVEYLHIDVMDGHFVPNITIGPVVVKSLRKVTDMIFDVHLMIENPGNYVEFFAKAGADIITVHYEGTNHIHGVIQSIKAQGKKAGVSVNPGTPLNVLEEILPDVDLVLVMSVNPGFGGQKLIANTLEKTAYLKQVRKQLGLDFLIEMDGGIKDYNVKDVIDAGTDLIVAGSAVFNGKKSIAENVDEFNSIFESIDTSEPDTEGFQTNNNE